MPNEPASAPSRVSPPPEKWNRRTQLLFASGMALLIATLVAGYMQASSGLDAMRRFGISSLQADDLDQVLRLMLQQQATLRGYALDRDPAYLDAYRTNAPKLRAGLRLVEQNATDDLRPEVTELVNKANATRARLDHTMERLERGERRVPAWFDEGTRLMQEFKDQHARMKGALLAQSLDTVKDSVRASEIARALSVSLAIASLLLLVLAIAQKQKQQELLERIQHLLVAENERLEREVRHRTEELTQLASYLTTVRETEKLDLARELHDELGALLTAAKLDADSIARSLPPEARLLVAQRVARLRQSLVGGITLKRRIIDNLRPALLYDLGLIEALKALLEEFRLAEQAIEVQADLPETGPDLADDVALSLFRIVQEALTNIRKYAQARHVRVSLRITATGIELSVADDGVGFDLDAPTIARHGLAGIRHRVLAHGGTLDIHTAPGVGVELRAVLPA